MVEAGGVLVTGGTGALGRAVAAAFVKSGFAVAVTWRNEAERREFQTAIPDVPMFRADLAVASEARSAIHGARESLGGLRVLAHLAGGFSLGGDVASTSEETWDRMMDVNLKSAFLVCREALPSLRESAHGTAGPSAIVLVGSRNALEPAAGSGAYNASKAGLLALMRTIALEEKERGVRCNAVLPSIIDNPANRKALPKADASRWVTPDSIAGLIVYLCSSAARDVTGASIPIYGRA